MLYGIAGVRQPRELSYFTVFLTSARFLRSAIIINIISPSLSSLRRQTLLVQGLCGLHTYCRLTAILLSDDNRAIMADELQRVLSIVFDNCGCLAHSGGQARSIATPRILFGGLRTEIETMKVSRWERYGQGCPLPQPTRGAVVRRKHGFTASEMTLYCVGWGVKLYSINQSILPSFPRALPKQQSQKGKFGVRFPHGKLNARSPSLRYDTHASQRKQFETSSNFPSASQGTTANDNCCHMCPIKLPIRIVTPLTNWRSFRIYRLHVYVR